MYFKMYLNLARESHSYEHDNNPKPSSTVGGSHFKMNTGREAPPFLAKVAARMTNSPQFLQPTHPQDGWNWCQQGLWRLCVLRTFMKSLLVAWPCRKGNHSSSHSLANHGWHGFWISSGGERVILRMQGQPFLLKMPHLQQQIFTKSTLTQVPKSRKCECWWNRRNQLKLPSQFFF